MTSAKNFLFESITFMWSRPLTCMNVSTSCEDALPLNGYLEIHLQKGSVLCISWTESLWSSMRGGGAFTLSVVDASVGGVVSVSLSILLWVWVAGPSGVVVNNMWIETLEVAGVSLTSTNYGIQSAALMQAPDFVSTVMLYVASSRDHLLLLMFAFLLFRNFCKGLQSLQTTMSDPCG